MRAIVLMLFLVGVLIQGKNIDQSQFPLSTPVPKHFWSEIPSAYNYHVEYGTTAAALIKKVETNKINKGDLSFNENVPYMGGVAIILESGDISMCGSSLLSNTKLVTAAHCWWDGITQASSFTIVLGSDMLFVGGTRIATTNVDTHYDWRPKSSAQNDIAMITIPQVAFTENIRPIDLPSGSLLNNDFAGAVAQATGFGLLADVQEWESWLLHSMELKIMTNSECSQYWGGFADSMMCTSGAEGLSTCHGDLGGPLAFSDGGKEVLIGIGSFVNQYGCIDGLPAGFTRVAPYVKWIQL